MNQQEKAFFTKLTEHRSRIADALDDPCVSGYQDSVVEKYSDQAHFIYELLQNADDAHATSARFVLEPTRLIFAHNGTRHFSISNPATEKNDRVSGLLGDINSITSIANSNKTEASIGKFGVGFKSVFQYTSTPHIYDPEFCFKIERFIVPVVLEEDFPARHPEETLFVFPFDHAERNAEMSFEDISDKLRNLSYPLLFLSNLRDIDFTFRDVLGLYGKSKKREYAFGDIRAELICLMQNKGDTLYEENLWLFSRIDECQRRFCVGFFLDDNGKLRPINEPAFCFFPTKERTGLHFIIHAPFLLTDSREGIQAGKPHNDQMLKLLSDLAADSLVCLKTIGEREGIRLIDDSILSILPYNVNDFIDSDGKNRVSFFPFYEVVKEKMGKEEILPSVDGYVSSRNAYWAATPQLPQLFSNEQIKTICDNDAAGWVFVSIGRDDVQSANKTLCKYIDSLVRTNINDEAIISGRAKGFYYNRYLNENQQLEPINGINATFIEHQSIAWLHRFYQWLSASKTRTKAILKRPIFLNQDKKATAAFDKSGQPILFLPVPSTAGYTVIHPALLENPETRSFIEEVGINPPSLRDQIYNNILPLYKSDGDINTEPHFQLFFEYYCDNCMNGKDEDFITLIKDYEFLLYHDLNDSQLYRGAADTMYLPSPNLVAYFETKPEVRFLAFDYYLTIVGASKEKQLVSFLTELGVKKEIEIKSVSIKYSTDQKNLPLPHATGGRSWEETIIIGCKEIIDFISSRKDTKKSVLLWNCLISIIRTRCSRYSSLSDLLKGTCRYYYYKWKQLSFSSSDVYWLKQRPWLINKQGKFVTAENLTISTLSDIYNISSNEAKDLLGFLGIEDMPEEDENANLTDTQREKISFADKLLAMGFDDSDLEELQRIKQRREASKSLGQDGNNGGSNDTASRGDVDIDEMLQNADSSSEDSNGDSRQRRKINKTTSEVIREIANRTKGKYCANGVDSTEEKDEYDEDEFTPAPVDYSRRIEREKQKSAQEIDKIEYYEGLQRRAMSMPKYSFGWFKALLEMESLSSGEANANSKEISISFAKVEREPGTSRILILKHPSRYIPQFMEELADIPLILHTDDGKKTVAIEVVNVKSYTLRVKLKNGADLDGIDFSSVREATIDAKSPAFLQEALRKQFDALNYSVEFNMQENLCDNIEFVFGPPGTGKTTYLADKVLLPLMAGNEECKVLVLTPTNKASDVLVRRIMELSGKDRAYEDWLIRFGATGDEEIEHSPVFRDKTFDIRTLSKNVTITTIARFPYDFFMPQDSRIFLNGINWDYIVIDEASMIPIANIIYPLYKKTPKKFIIAGDPFQIEPITSVNLWKNENIYTLVQLDSFANPQTVPHPYKVHLLTTQYRSIPEIGGIFSRFAYDGILTHHRSSESRRTLNIEDEATIKAINIIKYPVSKYESIYRAKRLQNSSYQIYSALFTFEYICRMAKDIANGNPGSLIKIGVIAPYRAQADLINRLFDSEKKPCEVDIQVGTIHGFQGDECDIIFAVFNTPPTISDSKDMFLNKLNIINVSISRARDYLYIIMPDDETDNIDRLRLVKKVECLAKDTNAWTESFTSDLEEQLFGNPRFLEENSFSTSHQSVNVYGLPEKRYEVRTEDSAVDIQIYQSKY